ncbi:hypothetical protein Leryth_026280, partial [Lithospermum erythrorhizon]
VDNPNEVLQQMQLESVASSREIWEDKQNEHIQKLIYNINFSANSESAMQDDSFCIFTKKILTVVTNDPTSS